MPETDQVTPPHYGDYPPFVRTPAESLRWDLAVAVAAEALAEPPGSKFTRFAAERLYVSEMPT